MRGRIWWNQLRSSYHAGSDRIKLEGNSSIWAGIRGLRGYGWIKIHIFRRWSHLISNHSIILDVWIGLDPYCILCCLVPWLPHPSESQGHCGARKEIRLRDSEPWWSMAQSSFSCSHVLILSVKQFLEKWKISMYVPPILVAVRTCIAHEISHTHTDIYIYTYTFLSIYLSIHLSIYLSIYFFIHI